MNFKVGDKIKFLDQKGGGVVVRVLSSTMICVQDQDGFEIPVLYKDVIKIEEENQTPASKLFLSQKPVVEPNIESRQVEEAYPFETISALRHQFGREQMEEGIYLAFVPHDQAWLLTGDVDVYVLNHTPIELFYHLIVKEESLYQSIDYCLLPAHSKSLVSTLTREDFPKWEEGFFQAVFYSESSTRLYEPISTPFIMKGSRFYKENQYISLPLLGEKGICIQLQSLPASPFMQTALLSSTKEQEGKKKTSPQVEGFPLRMLDESTAEIDLHIENLDELPSLLQPHEIRDKQWKAFVRALDLAIEKGLKRLIVIHGVGKGVLKSEIQKELAHYEGLHLFDASMAKYGVGATEILIGKSAHKKYE